MEEYLVGVRPFLRISNNVTLIQRKRGKPKKTAGVPPKSPRRGPQGGGPAGSAPWACMAGWAERVCQRLQFEFRPQKQAAALTDLPARDHLQRELPDVSLRTVGARASSRWRAAPLPDNKPVTRPLRPDMHKINNYLFSPSQGISRRLLQEQGLHEHGTLSLLGTEDASQTNLGVPKNRGAISARAEMAPHNNALGERRAGGPGGRSPSSPV